MNRMERKYINLNSTLRVEIKYNERVWNTLFSHFVTLRGHSARLNEFGVWAIYNKSGHLIGFAKR